MKTMGSQKSYIKRDTFDFEIGYLKKSPCLDCKRKEKLPACAALCPELDAIQTVLAAGIELGRNED